MNRNKRESIKHGKSEGKGKQFNRDTVLADLHEMLESMAKKIVTGRISDKESFKLKLLALKAFAYSASVFSSVLDASENESIAARLTIIEEEYHNDKGKTQDKN